MSTHNIKKSRKHGDSKTKILSGTTISPGYAKGIMHLYRGILGPEDSPSKSHKYNADEEIARLDQATFDISNELMELANLVEKEIDARLAEVFDAHKMILNDSLLRSELRKEIVENFVSASIAVKSVFLRWEKRFLLMESIVAKEKADDMRDISIRLCNALAGITIHPLEKIPKNCVLVTTRLLPSDTIFLKRQSVVAVLLEYGSFGSHAALFARQMGLPCISDVPNIMNLLKNEDKALVDANKGVVTLNPTKIMEIEFEKNWSDYLRMFKHSLTNATKAAVTKDGISVKINANIGCYEDSCRAYKNGADGIGLYRLEQFYMGRTQPPSIDELVNELRRTLGPFRGKPVTVRLLDVGSDKPLQFTAFLSESNPSLGRRGVRLMREYPDLLYTQIKAIVQLLEEFELQILVPMVTLPDDMEFVRDILIEQCSQHNLASPKLGAMIETPAAALSAKQIGKFVDFMSFGTNDLTQYAFAADRENASVEPYFKDSSDVIFRLISIVHEDVPTMPLSVCGELAGRQKHTEKLLLSGISSLSVAAPLVSIIKQQVRSIRLDRNDTI